jgi:hypothetical protein
MVAGLVMVGYLSFAEPAYAAKRARGGFGAGLPVSCATVNKFKDKFSMAQLKKMAASAGYKITPRMMAEARACANSKV